MKARFSTANGLQALATVLFFFATLTAVQADETDSPVKLSFTGPKEAKVGERVACEILVTNTSTKVVTAATLRASFGPGLTHVGGSVSPMECVLGDIRPGKTVGKILAFDVMASGSHPQLVDLFADDGVTASAAHMLTGVPVGVPAGVPTASAARSAAISDAEAAPADSKWVVELKDGSKLIGEPVDPEPLEVKAKFGSVKLDWKLIRGVKAGLLRVDPSTEEAGEDYAFLQMQDGDRISGVLANKEIMLDTKLGKLKIPFEKISHIHRKEDSGVWVLDADSGFRMTSPRVPVTALPDTYAPAGTYPYPYPLTVPPSAYVPAPPAPAPSTSPTPTPYAPATSAPSTSGYAVPPSATPYYLDPNHEGLNQDTGIPGVPVPVEYLP